jgi:hypothetical protein
MIPVILIHNGNSGYLQYSIKKALERNIVYLIGDTDPSIQDEKFVYVKSSNYITEEYKQFEEIYEHLSTNDYAFEIFCFLRWFIIKEFMLQNKICTSFYIDSDVMLYVNVNDEWKKFDQYDFTLLHRTAAVSSFITKIGIENFCKFLLNTYKNKNTYQFEKIASHYTIRKKYGLAGGVCDMTLLDFFHYHADVGGGPGKVGEMMTIIDGSTYDHNILAADQYFEFDGYKKVKMINGIPYVFSIKIGKLIRFNSLHFNSHMKVYMKDYF